MFTVTFRSRRRQASRSHRRVIVIWPLVNDPVHEFEPPKVPVIVVLVPSTRAVPVARAVHPDDTMLLIGMSIVKVISSPDIVPEKAPGIRPGMPAKLIEPVTVDPLCVSGHVIVPMPAWPIRLPAPIELLESEPLPAQVPVMPV